MVRDGFNVHRKVKKDPKDRWNKIPYDDAMENNYTEIAELLKK